MTLIIEKSPFKKKKYGAKQKLASWEGKKNSKKEKRRKTKQMLALKTIGEAWANN